MRQSAIVAAELYVAVIIEMEGDCIIYLACKVDLEGPLISATLLIICRTPYARSHNLGFCRIGCESTKSPAIAANRLHALTILCNNGTPSTSR